MGRPPVPPHLKRDKRLVVMLTEEETVMLANAASQTGKASLSEWVRETLVAAAQARD